MQIPEQFGPIRTVAEGKGDVILIGTTRNFVLQGTLSGDFAPITQVCCGSAGLPPTSACLREDVAGAKSRGPIVVTPGDLAQLQGYRGCLGLGRGGPRTRDRV